MKAYFSLIKFSHTVFALPFALLGFFLAWMHTDIAFSWKLLGLVVLCMVFARSAAMAFNRYLDRALVVPTVGRPAQPDLDATLAFFSSRP